MTAAPPTTVAGAIRRNGTDPAIARRPFLLLDDRRWTHAELYAESIRWAHLFLALRRPERPFHVGVLLENVPEYLFAFGGAALAGAVVVGLNDTRRGADLARDVRHTDCGILVTAPTGLGLLAGIRRELPELSDDRLLVTRRHDSAAPLPFGRDLDEALSELRGRLGARMHRDPESPVAPGDRYVLVFTSGTTAAPKAVNISHGRMISTGEYVGGLMRVGPDDGGYLAMPLFHASSQQCGFMPALLRGARLGLIGRFSKSRWLDDVRRYRVTYFNYTGKPLAYILTTPRRPDDADNPLRVCYGNEGSHRIVAEFSERFGCEVIDGFGATEGGFGFPRSADDPPGSVGRPPASVRVLREDGTECPPARFDPEGRVVNAEEAIGEIVNTAGTGKFEGYYRNEEATAERTRGGMYWSGDWGYRDADGYLYFTGRSPDWIRVDGENFLAKPIEDALQKHPGVYMAAAYGVPDAEAGDRVMAAIVLADDADLEPKTLYRFLADLPDFSPKWMPAWVRIGRDVPMTPTNKILVRELRRQGFRPDRCPDPVWWRERGETGYKPFTRDDYERIRRGFARAGRAHLLDL